MALKQNASATFTVDNIAVPSLPPSPNPGSGVAMGAFVDGAFVQNIRNFDTLTQGDIKYVIWMDDWTSSFNAQRIDEIRGEAMPIISWHPMRFSAPDRINQPDYQLSDIINGNHDAYIRSRCTECCSIWQTGIHTFRP